MIFVGSLRRLVERNVGIIHRQLLATFGVFPTGQQRLDISVVHSREDGCVNKNPRQTRVFFKLLFNDEFAQFATEIFHEIQFALANLITLHDFDLDDDWRRRWEDLFDAESVADLTNNKGL